jgi:hypothetical protein
MIPRRRIFPGPPQLICDAQLPGGWAQLICDADHPGGRAQLICDAASGDTGFSRISRITAPFLLLTPTAAAPRSWKSSLKE